MAETKAIIEQENQREPEVFYIHKIANMTNPPQYLAYKVKPYQNEQDYLVAFTKQQLIDAVGKYYRELDGDDFKIPDGLLDYLLKELGL